MRERRLSWAVDREGSKVFVDDLKGEQLEQTFQCPHCFHTVYAKRGEKKVWHFAHKGEECEYVRGLKDKRRDPSKEVALDAFMDQTIDLDDFTFEESDQFTCALCRKEENKDNGHSWSRRVWICKDCYMLLTDEQMTELERRSRIYV